MQLPIHIHVHVYLACSLLISILTFVMKSCVEEMLWQPHMANRAVYMHTRIVSSAFTLVYHSHTMPYY